MLVSLTAIFENDADDEYTEEIFVNVNRIDYIHACNGRTVIEMGDESFFVKEPLDVVSARIINTARATHGI